MALNYVKLELTTGGVFQLGKFLNLVTVIMKILSTAFKTLWKYLFK